MSGTTAYTLTNGAIQSYSQCKRTIQGLGAMSNSGSALYEIYYDIALTTNFDTTAIDLYTRFGNTQIGLTSIVLAAGSYLLRYFVNIQLHAGGTDIASSITYHSTLDALGTTYKSSYNLGGDAVITGLTNYIMSHTFFIRCGQSPNQWSGVL